MLAKIKTNTVDLKKYPEFFQGLLEYMKTYNISNTEMAKIFQKEGIRIHRQDLDRWIKHPEKIPNPPLFTAILRLLPDFKKSLEKYIEKGKNGHKPK